MNIDMGIYHEVRITEAAVTALESAGATVVRETFAPFGVPAVTLAQGKIIAATRRYDLGITPTYTVALGNAIPIGIVVARTRLSIAEGAACDLLSLRMSNDPAWPGEIAARRAGPEHHGLGTA